jgi:hypothetical protein
MKKRIISLVFAGVIILLSGAAVSAADVGVGASFWYADWKMTPVKTDTNNHESKMDPELMFGPVISAKFSQNWSVAAAFLVSNKYQMGSGPDSGVRRMDSDTTLNYNINSYFKIFPGIKLMQFTFTDGYHRSGGPGLGAGFIFPLSDSFFLIGNGSGSYLFGQHSDPGSSKISMREYGYNLNGGLAYYLTAASLTINAGYRYQYFRTAYVNANANISDLNHVFKGFTMSIIFSF